MSELVKLYLIFAVFVLGGVIGLEGERQKWCPSYERNGAILNVISALAWGPILFHVVITDAWDESGFECEPQ